MNKADGIIIIAVLLLILALTIIFSIVVITNIYLRTRRKLQKLKKRETELELELTTYDRRIREIVESDNNRFNYLNSVFSCMGNGIVLFNSNGKPVFLNHVGRKFLKIEKSVFFKEDSKDLNPFYERVIRHSLKTYESRVPETFEHVNDGKTYKIQCVPVYDRYERQVCIGVMADISDLTRLKEIEEARKEFVSNVSHEFRTPMTLIAGYVETLSMWDELDPQNRQKCLEVISYETRRLERLVQELLTLSRLDKKGDNGENISLVNIKNVIEKIFSSLSNLADEKSISLESDIKISGNILISNEQFFYQMLFNLVENGIKYNKENGYVKVSVRNDTEKIYIKIKDNGLGIDKKEHKRIFERFYRIEKDRNSGDGGNGIGLSIVDMALKRMNGKISLESEIHKGTEFTIVIPLRDMKRED